MKRHSLLATGMVLTWLSLARLVSAQVPTEPPPQRTQEDRSSALVAPDRLEIRPMAQDDEIGQRLQGVLAATNWFGDVSVRVESGVVFLAGEAESSAVKEWATDLARNTEGVVAVANGMHLRRAALWDFSPAWNGLRDIWDAVIRSLPLLVFAAGTLLLSFFAGRIATRGAERALHPRIRSRLLRSVVAHGAGVLVFLIGAYVVLRIAGLTQLALTLLGGTGLVGLALGIAFRTIAENFLASVFLSVQRPFEPGDLIEVAGVTGYVQQLNLRTTIIMDLDGNLVQIPNATVYNGNLCNFTANPDRRTCFGVGIGYDDSIQEAQEIVRQVLATHPAVLQKPAPAILVESLGRATVNLQIYFWLNGREHSWMKVRSSVMRLVKVAFQEQGVSMPDEAREVIFPQGVPVHVLQPGESGSPVSEDRRATKQAEISSRAEAGLYSEAAELEQQANQAPLRDSENLLRKTPDSKDV